MRGLRRVFNGSLSLMLVHYARNKKLSGSEIDALRKIIDEQKGR